MSSHAGSPRAKSALDRITTDQQKLVREHLELAASKEDGPNRRSESWLDAKFHQAFAEYLAQYDPAAIRLSFEEAVRTIEDKRQLKDRRNWLKWRRFLN